MCWCEGESAGPATAALDTLTGQSVAQSFILGNRENSPHGGEGSLEAEMLCQVEWGWVKLTAAASLVYPSSSLTWHGVGV